jgi:hypothetical protein
MKFEEILNLKTFLHYIFFYKSRFFIDLSIFPILKAPLEAQIFFLNARQSKIVLHKNDL